MACMNSEKQLDIGDAIKLLENIDQYQFLNLPPVKPKAGEVFLFVPTCPEDQGGSWLSYDERIQFHDLSFDPNV